MWPQIQSQASIIIPGKAIMQGKTRLKGFEKLVRRDWFILQICSVCSIFLKLSTLEILIGNLS